jgi:hypothetical protein
MRRWIAGFPLRLRVTVVPALNIGGVLRSRRVNTRGVVLNRNMATNDWSPEIASSAYHPGPAPNSEPETRALVTWLNDHRPVFVLSPALVEAPSHHQRLVFIHLESRRGNLSGPLIARPGHRGDADEEA